jgi:DNA-binding transcriptional LysR family regulator
VCLEGLCGDYPRPTMQQLVCFVHVAELASFAAAARRMAIDPSTVRESIGDLEGTVGLRLFDRSQFKITMTRAGQLVLPIALRIVYLASVLGQVEHQ